MSRQRFIRLSNNVTAQRIAVALVCVILLVMLIQMFGKAYREQGYDFTSYLMSADALAQSENPYETDSPFPYLYPMLFAVLLIPLSALPYWLSNFLWFAVNAFCLFYAVYTLILLAADRIGTKWGRHLYVPLAILFILLLTVTQNNLLNGQVNFVVLLLCVLFLKCLLEKQDISASIFLALGISIKLVPLIFLIFVLFRKNYRVFLMTIAFAIVLQFIPYMFLGHEFFSIQTDYVNTVIVSPLTAGVSSDLNPMFFTASGFLSYINEGLRHSSVVNIIAVLAVLLPLIALEILNIRRKAGDGSVWIFTLYLLAILLISPMSEVHHLAYLIPAVVLIALTMLFDRGSLPASGSIAFIAFFVLFYLGKAFKHGPFYFLAVVALFCIVGWINMRPSTNSRSGSDARRAGGET